MDNLVGPSEYKTRRASLAVRQPRPCGLLVHHGRKAHRAHEAGDEALVVLHHPSHVPPHAALQLRRHLVTNGIRRLLDRDVHELLDRRRRRMRLHRAAGPRGSRRAAVARAAAATAAATTTGPLAPLGARRDGPLQSAARERGEHALGDDAGLEDEAREAPEVGGADKPRGREQHQAGDRVREGGREMHRDAAAERVAEQVEAAGAGPGQRRRGQREQRLRDVQARVVWEVADAVGEAAAPEVLREGEGRVSECCYSAREACAASLVAGGPGRLAVVAEFQ